MSKEAMQQALEGAANYIDTLGGDSRKYRQALAEQPAQRTGVGLTDEEIDDIFEINSANLTGGEYDGDEVMYDKGFENAVATIEAKLKEKNT